MVYSSLGNGLQYWAISIERYLRASEGPLPKVRIDQHMPY